MTGAKCQQPDTMSGTGEIFISGAGIFYYRYPNQKHNLDHHPHLDLIFQASTDSIRSTMNEELGMLAL